MRRDRHYPALLSLTAAVAVWLPASAGVAQTAAVTEGQRLSQGVCARCHVIVADGPGSWTDAPPFPTIANRPGANAKALADFILQPHMHMLTNNPTRVQAEQIAAYILSLRTQ